MSVPRLMVLAAVCVFLVGCAKPPQQEIEAARQALSAAEAAEAATYASDALTRAQEAQQAVEQELKTQADKFALFRSYKHAGELITEANARAEEAQKAAVEGKQQAKEAAEQAQAQVTSALEEANSLMAALAACPRKPKGFAADMEALQGQLDGLTTEAAGVAEAIGREDFKGAQAAATTVLGQIQTLTTDLTAAKEKLRC